MSAPASGLPKERFPFLYESMDAAVAAVLERIRHQADDGGVEWDVALLVPRTVLGSDALKVQVIAFATDTWFESPYEEARSQYLWAVNRFAKVVGAVRALKVTPLHDDVFQVWVECADGADSVVYSAKRESSGRLGAFVYLRTNLESWIVPNEAPDRIYGRVGVDVPLLSFDASQRYAELLGNDAADDDDGDDHEVKRVWPDVKMRRRGG